MQNTQSRNIDLIKYANCIMLDEKKFVISSVNVSEYIDKISSFINDRVRGAMARGVVLGMSGGIDCSVVACLCKTAGVPISLIMLPDGIRKDASTDNAMRLIERFGFEYKRIDISPVCKSIEDTGAFSAESRLNIRPRVRMTLLYSIAQTEHRLVIGTSNIAERLIGYFTKWGDGASDLNPLGMLTKGEVRILASALKLPDEIISAPPSAGLYQGQTDEGDLGLTYAQIDGYVLNGTSGDEEIDAKIKARYNSARHKLNSIPLFCG